METNVIKKRMQRLIVAIVTVALVLTTFTLIPVASQIANPDSDRGVAYAAAKKVKVTYKANGGKFTAKKYAKKKSYSKKIKKGKKIGALPKIKRSGYKFKGWYTKKSGGKKVTKNTKVKKNTTYYAQWKKGSSSKSEKKSRTLTPEEKKLVGTWGILSGGGSIYDANSGEFLFNEGVGTVYTFKNDGTFDAVVLSNYSSMQYALFIKGTWTVSSGKILMPNRKYKDSRDGGKTWSGWTPMATPNKNMKYKLGNDEQGLYLEDTEDNIKFRKW